jgi:NADPH2:quinone reductase
MKAMIINSFGGSSVFNQVELPTPEVISGSVLIKVAATSVNPVDCKIRSGKHPNLAPAFPAILHGDVAGTISAVGEAVDGFKLGDEVYGCAGGLSGIQGALADFMLADARLIAPKPTTLSFEQAAALPLVTLTAWEGLFEKARELKGRKVLIHAATGGVGHIAIQLAKWAGAEVYATASTSEKQEIAKKLGAKDAINYKQESVADYVERLTNGHGFDVVFDTIGGENIERSFEAAAHYGEVISIQSGGKESYALGAMHGKSLSLHFVFMLLPMLRNIDRQRHGEILRKAAALVDSGKLKPLVDPKQFTFNEVGRAHDYLESGKATGKVVLSH